MTEALVHRSEGVQLASRYNCAADEILRMLYRVDALVREAQERGESVEGWEGFKGLAMFPLQLPATSNARAYIWPPLQVVGIGGAAERLGLTTPWNPKIAGPNSL